MMGDFKEMTDGKHFKEMRLKKQLYSCRRWDRVTALWCSTSTAKSPSQSFRSFNMHILCPWKQISETSCAVKRSGQSFRLIVINQSLWWTLNIFSKKHLSFFKHLSVSQIYDGPHHSILFMELKFVCNIPKNRMEGQHEQHPSLANNPSTATEQGLAVLSLR